MEKYRNVEVPFYKAVYQVSDEGSVRSLGRYVDNNGTLVWVEGRDMTPSTNKYRRNTKSVYLCYKGIKQRFFVHTLVALTFPEICGEYFEGAEVDYKDGNPENNFATNLHWVDRSGNMNNPVTKEKLSNIVLNNPEERKRRAERMKGDNNPTRRCMTDEWRAKLGQGMKGRKHTDEAKKKMSDAAKGKFIGDKSPLSKGCGYYDENGVLVSFGGYREAARETGINRIRIAKSIETKTKTKEGIQWIRL